MIALCPIIYPIWNCLVNYANSVIPQLNQMKKTKSGTESVRSSIRTNIVFGLLDIARWKRSEDKNLLARSTLYSDPESYSPFDQSIRDIPFMRILDSRQIPD